VGLPARPAVPVRAGPAREAVWGAAFLLEAALRLVIVYSTSTGTALAISTVTAFVFAGIMVAWTIGYGTLQKKKTERMAAEASLVPGPGPAAPEVPKATA
jgi:hypothetical protein